MHTNRLAAAMAVGFLFLAACSPVTVVQRAVEERSMADIAADNRIVLAANRVMTKYTTATVSTEIYEQTLLVYGMVKDPAVHDGMRAEIGAIDGVRRLHWHVHQMSEAEQEARDAEIVGFAEGLKIKADIETAWLGAEGVESLNFRIAVGPLGDAYMIGRAKSAQEMERAVAVVRNTEGVRRLTNYASIR